MAKSTVEHGDPKAPPPKQSTEGHTPKFTEQNTSLRSLMKMGRHPKMSTGGAKTPA